MFNTAVVSELNSRGCLKTKASQEKMNWKKCIFQKQSEI